MKGKFQTSKMTIISAVEKAKEIPIKVHQLIEMGNRAYGLCKRLLRVTNLNIELYEEVMEICQTVGSIWKDVESVWRDFEEETKRDPQVFQQLDRINEIVMCIDDLSIQSTTGSLNAKENLRLLKEHMNNLTFELTLF